MRGAGVDRRLQPVINLATNPSFETTLGTVTARTNLAAFPIPTASATANGSVKITTRYGAYATESWGNTGSGLSGSLGTYFRRTYTSGSAPSTGAKLCEELTQWNYDVAPSTGSAAPVTANTTYTISFYIRMSNPVPMAISWCCVNSTPATIGSATTVALPTLTANTWTRVSATLTTPASAVGIGMRVAATSGSPSVGDTMDLTGILFEQAPSMLPYFDGSASPDADLTASWGGTANASTSSLKGPIPTSMGTQNAVVVASSQWSQSGASSMRVIPTSASNDSAAIVAGDNGFQTLAGEGITFKPGHTYFVSAIFRLAAPLTGTLGARPRSLTLYTNSVTGTSGSAQTILATAPNTAGASTLSSVFTIPANAVTAVLRAYNGASMGNGDAWWDDLMLVDITDRQTLRPAYADGSTPGWKWLGTPNASQSAGPGLHA